jgi:hypothetical protein
MQCPQTAILLIAISRPRRCRKQRKHARCATTRSHTIAPDSNRTTTVRTNAQGNLISNALGQRVFKSDAQADHTAPAETTLGTDFITWLKTNFKWLFATAQANASLGSSYAYGDGQIPSWAILGEYNNGAATGSGRTEYIWLPTDDGQAIPVALFRGNRYYAIHSDHLGTPRLMTDDSAKAVWQWPYSAFGETKPTGVLTATANPNAAMTAAPLLKATAPAAALNLRYPGQYFDSETNLFYNTNRTYDPIRGGRYAGGSDWVGWGVESVWVCGGECPEPD